MRLEWWEGYLTEHSDHSQCDLYSTDGEAVRCWVPNRDAICLDTPLRIQLRSWPLVCIGSTDFTYAVPNKGVALVATVFGFALGDVVLKGGGCKRGGSLLGENAQLCSHLQPLCRSCAEASFASARLATGEGGILGLCRFILCCSALF